MKIFTCDNCGHLIYFENVRCNKCGFPLGYCPDTGKLCSFKVNEDGTWSSIGPTTFGRVYKQCKNYSKEGVCNWMIPIEENSERCISCNLNWVLPELDLGHNRKYWHKIEKAKRRLVFSIMRMNLPLKNKKQDRHNGLAFKFLEGPGLNRVERKPVMIGHNQGIITLNIAEANDAIRIKIREDMKERYRTLLGHFRHEIGHYYWMLLVANTKWLDPCRELFGDDQKDYNKALKKYYARDPEEPLSDEFISMYASSHPWEDWAETWAHYMHMYDTLETVNSWGLRFGKDSVRYTQDHWITGDDKFFDTMIDNWTWTTCALNSINRSMGLNDPYPFIVTPKVKQKLHFIHQVIHHRETDHALPANS